MTTTLLAISVVAILAVLLSACLYLLWEGEKEAHSHTRADLARETIEHKGTRLRLNITNDYVSRLAVEIGPLLTKTAWSMGGVTLPEMRNAEVQRNKAVDAARPLLMNIPVVADEGKRLVREGKMFAPTWS